MRTEQLQLALNNAINFLENKSLIHDFMEFVSNDLKADMENFILTGEVEQ